MGAGRRGVGCGVWGSGVWGDHFVRVAGGDGENKSKQSPIS